MSIAKASGLLPDGVANLCDATGDLSASRQRMDPQGALLIYRYGVGYTWCDLKCDEMR